jgi:tRNA (guanine37-N1)-methyltransferase
LFWVGWGGAGPEPAPADAETLRVPEVLLSGDHARIRRWRKQQAVARTLARRPDLLSSAALDEEERDMLRELGSGKEALS